MNKDGGKSTDLFRLFRGTSIMLGGKVIGGALLLGRNVFLARVLGAAGFGLFALASTAYDVGLSFAGIGFNSSLTKFIPMYKAKGETGNIVGAFRHVVYCVIASSVVVGALILIFAGRIAARFHKPEVVPLLEIVAAGIPTATLFIIYTTFTRSLHSMRASATLQNIYVPLIFIGAFICFHFLGYGGVMSAVAALVLADAAGGFLCIKHLLRVEPGLRLPGRLDKAEKKELHKYSGTIFSTNITATINTNWDTVLLGAFTTSAEIGIYRAAATVTYFMSIVMNALNMVFPQMVSEQFARGDMEKIQSLYRIVTRWLIYLCLPVALFLSLFSREAMELSFGQQYASGGPVIIVLAAGYLVNSTIGHSAYLLLMMGKQKYYAANQIGVSILTVLLGFVLIPSYGLMGAAIARSVSPLVSNLLMVIEIYTTFGFQPFDRACLTPLAISLAVFVPAYFFNRAFHMFWPTATFTVLAIAALTWYWGIKKDDSEPMIGLKARIMAGAKSLTASL